MPPARPVSTARLSREAQPACSAVQRQHTASPSRGGQAVGVQGPAAAAPRTPLLTERRARSASPVPARCGTQSLVTVIGPGAGMGANAEAYRRLGSSRDFRMATLGHSRAAYDRYPESWPNGAPEPNLNSFAREVLSSGVVQRSDCLVLGSRGGQVVLPQLWKALGKVVPPTFVINGGCATQLPSQIDWPLEAVTFLLIGGCDEFRRGLPPKDYRMKTIGCVPKGNKTTAVLYVQEMKHMPQAGLMQILLQPMLHAMMNWKAAARTPLTEFRELLPALIRGGWSGCLMYTDDQSQWQEMAFGRSLSC